MVLRNIILAGITLGSIGLRLWYINDGNLLFVYDQARDAKVSRQILEQADFKIFGPTASGSKDQLYHGVLYYYLIGPLYTLFHGNPQLVASGVALLISSSILISYCFAFDYTKNQIIAYLIAGFSAVSVSSVTSSGWLSNPVFLLVTVPWFHYCLLKTIQQPTYKSYFMTVILAGLCTQFSLFSSYMWIIIAISLTYHVSKQRLVLSIKHMGWLSLTAFLTIGSMLIAELLQYQRGILTFRSIGSGVGFQTDVVAVFDTIKKILLIHLNESFLPSLPIISVVVGILGIGMAITVADRKRRLFILLTALGPALFFSVQARGNYHLLLGYQPIFLTLILHGLQHMKKDWLSKYALPLLVLMIGSQLILVYHSKASRNSAYVVQKDILLKDQLRLIDFTYHQAKGQPFSISTLTVPFMYNTTWDYLYSWYGIKEYGYLPSFKGRDQGAQFGIHLNPTLDYSPLHYVIIEPTINLSMQKISELVPLDEIFPTASPSSSLYFGGIELMRYDLSRP